MVYRLRNPESHELITARVLEDKTSHVCIRRVFQRNGTTGCAYACADRNTAYKTESPRWSYTVVPGQSNNGCLCTREARTREPRRPELALKTQKCPPLERQWYEVPVKDQTC